MTYDEEPFHQCINSKSEWFRCTRAAFVCYVWGWVLILTLPSNGLLIINIRDLRLYPMRLFKHHSIVSSFSRI